MNIYPRNRWGENLEIQETIAVVTGGASGLGAATVRNIIKKGGKAVIFDLSEENGAKMAMVDLTGENADGYLEVTYGGSTGWADAAYLA